MQMMCGMEHLTLQVLTKMKVVVRCGNRYVVAKVEYKDAEHPKVSTA